MVLLRKFEWVSFRAQWDYNSIINESLVATGGRKDADLSSSVDEEAVAWEVVVHWQKLLMFTIRVHFKFRD